MYNMLPTGTQQLLVRYLYIKLCPLIQPPPPTHTHTHKQTNKQTNKQTKNILEQSTRFCSLSETSFPVDLKCCPSRDPVVLNAQQEPHWPCAPHTQQADRWNRLLYSNVLVHAVTTLELKFPGNVKFNFKFLFLATFHHTIPFPQCRKHTSRYIGSIKCTQKKFSHSKHSLLAR